MKVENSFTLLILPFTFDASNFKGLPNDSIWTPSKIAIENNFFFNHIHNYFTGNIGVQNIKSDSAVIYDLKDSFKDSSITGASDIINLFKKKHKVLSKSSDSETVFKFLLQKRKLASPKLFLFPLTSVGMITFAIEFIGEIKMSDLMEFNYRLEKYKISTSAKIEIILNSQREEEKEQVNKIYNSLTAIDDNQKQNQIANTWQFSQLINLFTHDLKAYNIRLKNSNRFHLFTYCQVNSEGKLQSDMMNDFARIIRCHNHNYKPIMNDYMGNKLIEQTFDNIHIGTCVEGAGIMIDSHHSNNLILDQYKDQMILGRYLWIYILAYHQRLSLCHMTEQLSIVDITEKATKGSLLELTTRLSKITIKTKFNDISDFTQHNTYNRFCMNNLGVNSYYDELKVKLEAISSVVNEITDKEVKRRSSRFERLAFVLLIPQIIFAFITVHADLFGVKTYSIDILNEFYKDPTVTILLFIFSTILMLPIFVLLAILINGNILKRK